MSERKNGKNGKNGKLYIVPKVLEEGNLFELDSNEKEFQYRLIKNLTDFLEVTIDKYSKNSDFFDEYEVHKNGLTGELKENLESVKNHKLNELQTLYDVLKEDDYDVYDKNLGKNVLELKDKTIELLDKGLKSWGLNKDV